MEDKMVFEDPEVTTYDREELDLRRAYTDLKGDSAVESD
jgi:hypothetical protein